MKFINSWNVQRNPAHDLHRVPESRFTLTHTQDIKNCDCDYELIEGMFARDAINKRREVYVFLEFINARLGETADAALSTFTLLFFYFYVYGVTTLFHRKVRAVKRLYRHWAF